VVTTDTCRQLLQHAPEIRRFVDRRIPQPLRRELDTEDLLHEVWLRVLRVYQHKPIPIGPHFGRYLRRTALTVLADRLRRRYTEKRGGEAGAAPWPRNIAAFSSQTQLFEQLAGPLATPSNDAARHEAASAVRDAMGKIPEDQRRAVHLRHLRGLSCEDVAARMQRSPQAIRGLLARGMEGLRAELGEARKFYSDISTATGSEKES
jgi:RNA polymerase sigma factor (sigma-70 family)